MIANLGDSRAILCTRTEEDELVPVQLTVDLKPDVPSGFHGLLFKFLLHRKWLARWFRILLILIFMIVILLGEAERIRNCEGRVFATDAEPGVYRIWMPDVDCPGLAMARAFGDFCLKDYGVISIPDVSYRKLTDNDEFVVLATDGVKHQKPSKSTLLFLKNA